MLRLLVINPFVSLLVCDDVTLKIHFTSMRMYLVFPFLHEKVLAAEFKLTSSHFGTASRLEAGYIIALSISDLQVAIKTEGKFLDCD
ncbi:hypothetical protein EJB05_37225 [Eragrostis curvula]|uniref:Uncharacterized protein n=1 Tax=Eragrostis curvula TaxID=38414 RepID=A0A5J9TRE9_9POAL|nr:hypothetical protein EJB05_37225 [Eragrostis curvula]